jgi:hypothetical protein
MLDRDIKGQEDGQKQQVAVILSDEIKFLDPLTGVV